MKKILLTGIMVILALLLAACALENSMDGDVVYQDWVLSDPDENGNKQLTLYFSDTPGVKDVGVPVKKSERAVGLNLANMSHDYFEAVFWSQATPATIARATWELGQNAGISGVYRPATGIDYRPFDPTPIPAGSTDFSVVFVGRKADKTLLGIGYLSHVDDKLLPMVGTALATTDPKVTPSTRSVTFTVIPITNNVTLDKTSLKGTADTSFWTSKGVAASKIGSTDDWTAGASASAVAFGTTEGRFSPLGGVDYPLFELPEVLPNMDSLTVYAKYNFTYPFIGTNGNVGGSTVAGYRNLAPAVRVINIANAAGITGLKPTIIKREVRFLQNGQLMYAQTALPDAATEVSFSPQTLGLPPLGSGGATAVTTNDLAFSPELNIVFKMFAGSNKKIFSIVFQVPCYALTKTESTNGAYNAETWYIRPGFGVPLYNLDNGKDAGGCVLLGTGVSALDWLEIKIQGVGLNEASQPTLPVIP